MAALRSVCVAWSTMKDFTYGNTPASFPCVSIGWPVELIVINFGHSVFVKSGYVSVRRHNVSTCVKNFVAFGLILRLKLLPKRHVLHMFVLKAVDYNQLFWWNLNKSTLQNTFKESILNFNSSYTMKLWHWKSHWKWVFSVWKKTFTAWFSVS